MDSHAAHPLFQQSLANIWEPTYKHCENTSDFITYPKKEFQTGRDLEAEKKKSRTSRVLVGQRV